MNHLVRRRLETCLRVEGFCAAHIDSFEPGSRCHELSTALDAAIARFKARAAEHDRDTRESRLMSAVTKAARDVLMAHLEAISHTSRTLELNSPGLKEKFRMPLAFPAQNLLKAARSFLASATPLKAAFIREELPADFLEQLSQAISDLESAIHQTHRTRGAKVSARTAQNEDIKEGMRIVRQLDVIMRNKFRGDLAVLTAWASASHVERHSRRASTSDDAGTSSQADSRSNEPSSESSPSDG